MQVLSAVVTTGIYCRPGCGGRPLPAHVRPYTLAAAAESDGFRPCLRCRPYRSAQPVSWTGPELVCRAVQLITDGALDGHTEGQLASRLGVSSRHLRRLFVAELGVTPDGLARSRRAHFARRLLDDTDLPVADIAFAAGFGSVRQLHRACRDIFRAAPAELRGRRRSTDRLVADGGLVLRLPHQGGLDWARLAAYLQPRAIPGVEHVDGETYRRTIVVNGDPGVLELGPGRADHLILRVHLPHWADLIHVVQRARHIPNLDMDLDRPAELLSRDPVLGPLVAAHPGVRPPGTWDPFETGVRAILGQQVSVAGATTLAGRVVARFGTPVPGLGPMGLSHTFPAAEVLADADLSGLGLTGARERAVAAFARSVVSGDVRLDRSVGLDQLVAALVAIPGLGAWTAHYLALRLGEPDAFPATDLGVRRALAARGHGSADAVGEGWRPWRALATAHLWAAGVSRTGATTGLRPAGPEWTGSELTGPELTGPELAEQVAAAALSR
jgi:AraC family transcriptional regulator, regulatory protein of adaptative response / DNA-3-methyladenine glycosylase II